VTTPVGKSRKEEGGRASRAGMGGVEKGANMHFGRSKRKYCQVM